MTNHWLHFANNNTMPGEYEQRSGGSFHIRLRRAGTSTVYGVGTTRVFDSNAPTCKTGRASRFFLLLYINGVIGEGIFFLGGFFNAVWSGKKIETRISGVSETMEELLYLMLNLALKPIKKSNLDVRFGRVCLSGIVKLGYT